MVCYSAISIILKAVFKHVLYIKGTSLRSGRVTHLKRKFSKTYIFLLPTFLVYENLFCSTLICALSIWQLRLKLECIR